MKSETTAKRRPRELVCRIPERTLRGLLMIARDPAGRNNLDRIHLDPTAGRLVAINSQMTLWVRMNMLTACSPFTLSGTLCAKALIAAKDSLEVSIDSVLQDARRRVVITTNGEGFEEREHMGPYPDPRWIFAIKTNNRNVDFDPEAMARLRAAISLVVANKQQDEPLHIIARGSAPAIVVCRSPYVMGFITPWDATANGDRWTKITLGEFGIAPSQGLPPTGAGRTRTYSAMEGAPSSSPEYPGNQAA